MGARGPKPKPDSIRSQKGYYDKKKKKVPVKKTDTKEISPKELNPEGKKLFDRLKEELENKGLYNRASREALAAMCMSYSIYKTACKNCTKGGKIDITMQLTTRTGDIYYQERPEVSIIKKFNKEIRDFCRMFGFTEAEIEDPDDDDGILD